MVALSTLKPVSGRFETLQSPTGFTAIVDYAHTPDALNNVIETINFIRFENTNTESEISLQLQVAVATEIKEKTYDGKRSREWKQQNHFDIGQPT